MKISKFLVLIGATLAGCVYTVNEGLISSSPVSEEQFSAAQDAAEICARHAPNWSAVEFAFKEVGYLETSDSQRKKIADFERSVVLEAGDSDVVVWVGSRGGEGKCLVGMAGMTPRQSYDLALPWVKKYKGLTNEERGQGLSPLVVQAWGTLESDRIVYIAAYKTWELLGEPGAAAKLMYLRRR